MLRSDAEKRCCEAKSATVHGYHVAPADMCQRRIEKNDKKRTRKVLAYFSRSRMPLPFARRLWFCRTRDRKRLQL